MFSHKAVTGRCSAFHYRHPHRSVAAIHRQMIALASEQGWKPSSYAHVRQIIKNLAPQLVTLAHEGEASISAGKGLQVLKEEEAYEAPGEKQTYYQ